jgi:hypothetical protein
MRRAALQQKETLLKRREDERRAKIARIEMYQREKEQEKHKPRASGGAAPQTFITTSEEVQVKIEADGQME